MTELSDRTRKAFDAAKHCFDLARESPTLSRTSWANFLLHQNPEGKLFTYVWADVNDSSIWEVGGTNPRKEPGLETFAFEVDDYFLLPIFVKDEWYHPRHEKVVDNIKDQITQYRNEILGE